MNHLPRIALVLFTAAVVSATPVITTTGVGTRSYGMGNNFVALANDYSAIYWNPAGLAFNPVREINVGVMGTKNEAASELAGTRTATSEQRVSLANVTWLRSIPTARGGFAFALGYSNPFVFDDLREVRGSDTYTGTDTVYGGAGTPVRYDPLDRLSYGGLDNWSASVGWQFAPRMGFGVAASLVTGSEQRSISTLATYYRTNGAVEENSETKLDIGYIGYDLRLGLLIASDCLLSRSTFSRSVFVLTFLERSGSTSRKG
jgi:hypothetical protein